MHSNIGPPDKPDKPFDAKRIFPDITAPIMAKRRKIRLREIEAGKQKNPKEIGNKS